MIALVSRIASLTVVGLALFAATGSAAPGTGAPMLLVSGGSIYVLDTATGHATNASRASGLPAMEASWSPDRRHIACQVEGGENVGAWVMTNEGRAAHRVAEGHIHQVVWRDARTVLFVLYRQFTRGEIHSVRADGSGLQNLTRGRGHDTTPTASPDGRRIAFARRKAGRPGLFVMKSDGTSQKRLTSSGAPGAITWSPDGRHIAFEVADRKGRRAAIRVIRENGTGLRTLVPSVAPGANPTWSPDGRSIAYQSFDPSGDYEINVVDARSAQVHNVTRDPSTAQTLPTWSPDGRRLAYFETSGSGPSGLGYVYVAGGDGSARRQVSRLLNVTSLSWAPAH